MKTARRNTRRLWPFPSCTITFLYKSQLEPPPVFAEAIWFKSGSRGRTAGMAPFLRRTVESECLRCVDCRLPRMTAHWHPTPCHAAASQLRIDLPLSLRLRSPTLASYFSFGHFADARDARAWLQGVDTGHSRQPSSQTLYHYAISAPARNAAVAPVVNHLAVFGSSFRAQAPRRAGAEVSMPLVQCWPTWR